MSDSSNTPTTLGPYRLESLLGRGGMGEVWAAHDSRLDRRVAIKHVQTAALADGDDASKARARFRREAWAAAKIAHPAVVPVFDVVEDASGDWIVMELVDGPTVRDLVDRDGPLPIDRVLRFGRQIADGLAAAHAAGLVHRDLKTENVMISPSGHVKILDFGLAKTLTGPEGEPTITVSGEVMGTVRSMSPEQARGFQVDARSDLFSLGTLLYELLTGTSPFRGKTPLDTLSRVVSHDPEPIAEIRPDTPPALSSLVAQLLQKAPERRPQTAADVATRLETLYLTRNAAPAPTLTPAEPWDGETVTDESSVDGVFATTVAPRSGTPIVVLLALVVSLAFGVVWFVGQRDGTPAESTPEARTPPLVEVDPQSFSTAYEAFVHGQTLLRRYDRKGHLPAAIEAFRRAVALDHEHAAAHAGLARALWLEYRTRTDPMWLQQATQAARRAVGLDQHLVASLTSSALVAIERGELEDARQWVDNALAIAPSDADVHFVAGELAAKERDTSAAIAAFRHAIELDERPSHVYNALGRTYLRTGQLDEAAETFRRGIELAEDNVYSRRNLAVVYQMQGRYDAAAEHLQRALEIRPSASLYANLGTLLFYQGLYESAAETYEKALDSEGAAQRPAMWANLGDAYRFVPGSEDAARQAFEQAIRLMSSQVATAPDADNRSRLATYLAKVDRCADALDEITSVVPERTVPKSGTRLLYRRVLVEELCDQREAALRSAEALLAAGYSRASFETDPELLTLRSDRRFQTILTDDRSD